MPYISAVIVGDKFTVAREAALRGIPAAFVREVRPDRINPTLCRRRETVIRTSPEHVTALASWMAETNHEDIIPGAGYPVGSCLIYSFHAGDTL